MNIDYKFSTNKEANEKWKALFVRMTKVGDLFFSSVKDMADYLGFSTSTVYRFLKRNENHKWVTAIKHTKRKGKCSVDLYFNKYAAEILIEKHTSRYSGYSMAA